MTPIIEHYLNGMKYCFNLRISKLHSDDKKQFLKEEIEVLERYIIPINNEQAKPIPTSYANRPPLTSLYEIVPNLILYADDENYTFNTCLLSDYEIQKIRLASLNFKGWNRYRNEYIEKYSLNYNFTKEDIGQRFNEAKTDADKEDLRFLSKRHYDLMKVESLRKHLQYLKNLLTTFEVEQKKVEVKQASQKLKEVTPADVFNEPYVKEWRELLTPLIDIAFTKDFKFLRQRNCKGVFALYVNLLFKKNIINTSNRALLCPFFKDNGFDVSDKTFENIHSSQRPNKIFNENLNTINEQLQDLISNWKQRK